jgi:hypothetical protein
MNKPTIALIIAAAVALFAAVLIQKSDAVVPPQRYLVTYTRTVLLTTDRKKEMVSLADFYGGTNALSERVNHSKTATASEDKLEAWILDSGYVAYTNVKGVAYSVSVNWQQNMPNCTEDSVAKYNKDLLPADGGAALVWDVQIEETIAKWELFKVEAKTVEPK